MMNDEELKNSKSQSELAEENKKLLFLSNLKSDMISLSSHNLRTSLTANKWMLKMLLDKDLGPLSHEQEQVLEKGYESNERMITLVNDLITFNNTNEISEKHDVVETDLPQFLEDIISVFQGASFKLGVNIIFLKPEHEVENFWINQKVLRTVFENLIDNALKYTKKGGSVFVSFYKKDGDIVCTVRDTGIGIPEDEQQYIFTKFYRAHNAEKESIPGSGLGLYIIKRIIEQIGGTMTFESKVNVGSTFTITIPQVGR